MLTRVFGEGRPGSCGCRGAEDFYRSSVLAKDDPSRDDDDDLGSSACGVGDRELRADLSRAFAHARQAEMPLSALSGDRWIEPGAVVGDAHDEILPVGELHVQATSP